MTMLDKIRKFISHEKQRSEIHYSTLRMRIFVDHTNEVLRIRNTMCPTEIREIAQKQLFSQYEQKLIKTTVC